MRAQGRHRRLAKPVEILMTMERVAVGPIDKADVRIAQSLAIVVERFARVQQHVGDPCDGNEIRHRIVELLERRQGNGELAFADVAEGAERIGEAAAIQAHLTEHGRQHDPHPDRLFAVVSALQGMADGDQGSDVRHAACQIHNLVGSDTADAGCPLRVLLDAILVSQQISLEAWIACRIAVKKLPVMPPLFDEHKSDREHEGDIGSGDAGSHSAARSVAISSLSGLMRTKRAPRARAPFSAGRTTCWLMPPPWTSVFLTAMPPKATISSLLRSIASQVTLFRSKLS